MTPKNTFSKSVCIYFQIHQPYRIDECSFFNTHGDIDHFAGPPKFRNKDVFEKVAKKCYLPATQLFLDLLKKHKEFRVSYSLSGVFLEQCEEYPKYGKKILDLLKKIAKTGQAEFLAETYFHSLSFLYSKEEYAEQIVMHFNKIKRLFGVTPRVFRNTELIYNNELGEFIRNMGFEGMLAEGWDAHLKGESPNHLRHAKPLYLNEDDFEISKNFAISKQEVSPLPLLLKNYKLSDDVAFRFGNQGWEEFPLDTTKYASWVDEAEGETVNLFMDYETIGEHQWEDTGIFEFFAHLPAALLERNIGFHTPSEAIEKLESVGEYDVHDHLSWADTERDISAWLENDIQKSALQEISQMEQLLHPHKKSRKKPVQELLHDFRKMQTSDHLYYMCTKYWSDGDVHKYFSAYESPYEAYINFMNTLRLLKQRFEEVK